MAVGMALGMEREWHEKAAGLRTMTLVAVGSALFTLYAIYAVGPATPRGSRRESSPASGSSAPA